MTTSTPDIIDLLAGIKPGSSLDRIRTQRPETREQAQKSYLALFEPENFGDVSHAERQAIASFVAGLHRHPDIFEFYVSPLEEGEANRWVVEVLKAEIGAAQAVGPYGRYPAGALSVEDAPGPIYQVSDAGREALGAKLRQPWNMRICLSSISVTQALGRFRRSSLPAGRRTVS